MAGAAGGGQAVKAPCCVSAAGSPQQAMSEDSRGVGASGDVWAGESGPFPFAVWKGALWGSLGDSQKLHAMVETKGGLRQPDKAVLLRVQLL